MRHKILLLILVFCSAATSCFRQHAGEKSSQNAVDSLVDVAGDTAFAYWTRVHALEDLCKAGAPEKARELLPGIASARTEPEKRIGYWRTAAKAAETQECKLAYIDSIRQVLLNPDAPDRTHAIEAMAKLNQPLSQNELQQLRPLAVQDTNFAAFLNWAEVYLEDGSIDRERIQKTLDGPDGRAKQLMQYALDGFIPKN